MNTFDAIVLGVGVSAALGGYRLGLVRRVVGWIGMAVGVAAAAALLPTAMRVMTGGQSLGMPIFALAVLSMGAAVGGSLGGAVGHQVRRLLPFGPIRTVDHVMGMGAGVLSVLVGVWLLLPLLAEIPGDVAREARESEVAQIVERIAPSRPDALESLRKFVGESRFPKVFESFRPAPDTGPVPDTTPVPPEVLERVRRSTVKVESFGCGALHNGSGFAVGPDLVATNAHVVAGGERVRVLRPDGRRLDARVVAFDDNRDLALLSVPRLGQTPLTVGRSASGQQGAVLGHPHGQDAVRIAPAAVRDKQPAVGRDIYGDDLTRRIVLFLAASLAQGDSGAPVIDARGTVVGVAFAIAPDRPSTAYAVADEELRATLAGPRREGTGPCIR